MSFSMFLHISLNLPDRWGFNPLVMDLIDNKPVLFRLLNSLTFSSRLKDIYIICSDKEVDDPIFLLCEQFKTNKVPVRCLRIQSGLAHSLESVNLEFNLNNPSVIKEVLGLYNLKFFLEFHKTINFEDIIVAWADGIPLLSGFKLDEIIDNFDGSYLSLGSENGRPPFILTSYTEVYQAYQELRSEITQDNEMKISTLNIQKSSKKKMQAFDRFRKSSLSIMDAGRKIRDTKKTVFQYSCLQTGINPFFILKDREDFAILESIYPLFNDIYEFFKADIWLDKKFFLEKKEEILKKFEIIYKRNQIEKINCNHLILDISNQKHDLKMLDVKDINYLLDQLSGLSIITFEQRFESLRNNNLPDLVEAASRKVSYIELKTFMSDLDNEYLIKLLNKGLKSLRLNLDNIKTEEKLYACIDNLLSFKETRSQSDSWHLFLEITFINDKEKLIMSLFHRYEYLVDKIIVLPDINKELNIIDFSPLEESKICRWSVNTLNVTSDLKLNLCEHYNKIQYDFTLENNAQLKSDRGNLDICKSCLFKLRANGYALEQDFNPLIKNKNTDVKEVIDPFQDYLIYFLSRIEDKDLISASKIVASHIGLVYNQSKKNIILQFANKLINYKEISSALDIIEIILKTDPASKDAHEILDKLCV